MHICMNRCVIIFSIISAVLAGCRSGQTGLATLSLPPAPTNLPVNPIAPGLQSSLTPDYSKFVFPISLDPNQRYLFYLHGKIIEDQGIPAVSPEFGEYQYEVILDSLAGYGFRVISEPRKKDTNPLAYAKQIVAQVNDLLRAGVPPGNITVVGVSKGGGIAILASNLLGNPDIRYVIMAICSPDEIAGLKKSGVTLSGKVLSIYDSADTLAGSCGDLFDFSEGKGLSGSKEIVLNVGTGHGIIYKPLRDWLQPIREWVIE